MSAFWTSGPGRYERGLRDEYQRRRAELLTSMQSAETDADRDRLRLEIESLDREYAMRRSQINRLLF
jgi:hypothetical protein